MPPKKKVKREKKNEEKAPKPTKSQYLARIAKQNAILAKTRTETRVIEDAYFDIEKGYEQLQEDMADIVTYLQHQIEENEKEIAVYDEKISEYRKEIKKNDKYYEEIFNKMKLEYEEKYTELNYQLQQLTAKLIACEDVKKERELYIAKREEILKKCQEIEARHQEEIYMAEKLGIIEQDKTQTDMENNLKKLVVQFTQATDITIGETTNRLIKDNVSLSNMLTCMQQIVEEKRTVFSKVQSQEKKHKYSAELLKEEQHIIMKRYMEQVNKIETLLRDQEELVGRIKAINNLIKENRRLLRENAKEDYKLKGTNQKVNSLARALEEIEETAESVRLNFNATRSNVLKLELGIFEAAKKAKEGLDVENLKQLEDREEDEVDVDKDEQEENLKEYKFKTREKAIEAVIEKLSYKLSSDVDLQMIAPSTESHLISFQSSLSFDVRRNRSSDMKN